MSFDTPLPPYNATDPTATFLNASCLDLLLIELVPMAYRLVNDIDSGESYPPSILDPSSSDAPHATGGAHGGQGNTGPGGGISTAGAAGGGRDTGSVGTAGAETIATVGGGGSTRAGGGGGKALVAGRGGGTMDEEEERDAVFFRLEMLGYRVGQGLVERFSRDRPRFTDTLDVIKFLCKDLWQLVFRKQIDNLKTNHRGVYVLTDNSFRPFARMSTEAGGQAVLRAQPFLWFPCGIIRGALASMGINATVHGETAELPGATFQIKSLAGKP